MPGKPPPLEYPDRFEVRYVSANGGIRWNRDWVNVSIVSPDFFVTYLPDCSHLRVPSANEARLLSVDINPAL